MQLCFKLNFIVRLGIGQSPQAADDIRIRWGPYNFWMLMNICRGKNPVYWPVIVNITIIVWVFRFRLAFFNLPARFTLIVEILWVSLYLRIFECINFGGVLKSASNTTESLGGESYFVVSMDLKNWQSLLMAINRSCWVPIWSSITFCPPRRWKVGVARPFKIKDWRQGQLRIPIGETFCHFHELISILYDMSGGAFLSGHIKLCAAHGDKMIKRNDMPIHCRVGCLSTSRGYLTANGDMYLQSRQICKSRPWEHWELPQRCLVSISKQIVVSYK